MTSGTHRTSLIWPVCTISEVEFDPGKSLVADLSCLFLTEPAARDAYYETEAVLDHLLFQANTPPFISKLLIQHFGISNPSPRFIEVVATAFQTGSYEWTDGVTTIMYGEGRWGDLAATAAAIIMDREATSSVLNADPTYGSVKEPLVKIVGFMRNMDFARTSYSKLQNAYLINGLNDKIGQMVYEANTVFNFFAPNFSPPGLFSQASLFSPESQVLSMITAVGMTNGLYSLITYGLNSCWYGLGENMNGCEYATGYLEYNPDTSGSNITEVAIQVIDDLATLTTSGRLSQANRDIILEQYESVVQSEGVEAALRVVQQLIATTPEFHTTSLVQPSGENRTSTPPSGSTEEPYKAVVYVFLFGGMDSFYMLAPHSSCTGLYDGRVVWPCTFRCLLSLFVFLTRFLSRP